VPVHIVYLTVRITADGIPQFYEDVYGRDALLAEGLFAADKNRPHAAMTHSF
jgi:murein L,D-transpeptidase YcbB/YkuD